MFKDLKYLSELDGASGFEYKNRGQIADMFSPYCDEVIPDKNGNLICIKRCGKENAEKWMIEAHFDQIGLMVKSVERDGFLTVTSIGGIDVRTLVAAEVTVHGKKEVLGIIGAKPPHLLTGKEKTYELPDLSVDTGLTDEEAEGLISVGDMVTLNRSAAELLNGRAAGRCFDDRAGVLAMLEALKRLPHEPDCDIYFVVAAQEETSSLGASSAAYSISPDTAIVIDVGHGTAEGASVAGSTFDLGEGLILTVGGNVHPALASRARTLCELKNIKYQLECEPGVTGTDAKAVQVSKTGIPTLLLSIPLRYMHTTVETLELSDIEAISALIVELIKYGSGIV